MPHSGDQSAESVQDRPSPESECDDMVQVPGWGYVPRGRYAYPGPERDQLVGALLDGEKTSTTSLVVQWEREDDPLPAAGDLEAVLDSADQPVCIIKNTDVQVCRMGDVTDEHARREGEGFKDVSDWRRVHDEFWTSREFVEELGDPPVTLTDDTMVVCVTFGVVDRL